MKDKLKLVFSLIRENPLIIIVAAVLYAIWPVDFPLPIEDAIFLALAIWNWLQRPRHLQNDSKTVNKSELEKK
jgi:hypothetical protein